MPSSENEEEWAANPRVVDCGGNSSDSSELHDDGYDVASRVSSSKKSRVVRFADESPPLQPPNPAAVPALLLVSTAPAAAPNNPSLWTTRAAPAAAATTQHSLPMDLPGSSGGEGCADGGVEEHKGSCRHEKKRQWEE